MLIAVAVFAFIESRKEGTGKGSQAAPRPSLFASKLRKLALALEKEEAEGAELASQMDIKDYYLEAQRWIGLFQRYERYAKDALITF
ncbi:MAG: hypothetical protein K6U04_02305 [Armatimonadetes bacterium]|nr:hypothetical protein [Armatimonadota bacterium]